MSGDTDGRWLIYAQLEEARGTDRLDTLRADLDTTRRDARTTKEAVQTALHAAAALRRDEGPQGQGAAGEAPGRVARRVISICRAGG